jgi:hypothetical protein
MGVRRLEARLPRLRPKSRAPDCAPTVQECIVVNRFELALSEKRLLFSALKRALDRRCRQFGQENRTNLQSR